MTSKTKSEAKSPVGLPDSQAGSMATLTVRQVAGLLQVHVRTVWRMAAAGEIPKPITIGRKTVRWRASDIQRFLDSR